MKNHSNKKGFSLVEILLATTIFAIFSVAVLYLSIDTATRSSYNSMDNQAILYAQEGLEAVRQMRDDNFLNLTNGDKGVELVSGKWSFVQAPQTLTPNYDRTITIEDVYRDSITNSISETGTELDENTKKVTVTILWDNGISNDSVVLSSYITNWRGDDFFQTTCAEFDNGTYTDTATDTLPAPPNDNCFVELSTVVSASDFLVSTNLGTHATDVQIDGNYAYAAVNRNNSGFKSIDISDPENPSVLDSINISQKGTHVVYDPATDRAFVGTSKKNQELAEIDTSPASNLSILNQEDLDGTSTHGAIDGNHLYLTMNDRREGLRVYDISSSGAPSLEDELDILDSGQFVVIDGNYAYVGTASDTSGLVIVDISNPSSLSITSTLDVGEEVNSIAIQGGLAYVGTEDSSDSLQVINISNPAAPVKVTSIDVNGEIQDLTISGDQLYAAIDLPQAGLSAIDISTPTAPVFSYSLDVSGKGSGIDSDANYVYVTTVTANKGLVIVGTTDSGVNNTGEYLSETYNTGSSDTVYNMIEWDHDEVPGGDIQFQIRTASSAAGIAAATWVGPDGTNSTFYTSPRTKITLDPGSSGPQYVQYKAILSSDGINSPKLNNVTINYTP